MSRPPPGFGTQSRQLLLMQTSTPPHHHQLSDRGENRPEPGGQTQTGIHLASAAVVLRFLFE